MNYRAVKKSNIKKTNVVMAIYIAIFFLLGLLGETIFRASTLPGDVNLPTAMNMVFQQIIHGQTFPLFTVIMTTLAFGIILVTIKMGNKLMLAGNQYVKLNEKENLTNEERMVLNIIEELKISSRLRFMPDVYIIEENYMNAFASGWKEDNSMVAITRGLLNKLNRGEVEAVLAHEIAHVKNADVRLTLVVGVLTNIMLLAVDILFYSVIGKNDSDNKTMQQAKLVIYVLRFVLPLLTIVLQLYISRKREFMADAGSVEFTGNRDAMISALKKISGDYEKNNYDMENENGTRQFAAIFSPKTLFSTHPSIEERIQSLEGTLKP